MTAGQEAIRMRQNLLESIRKGSIVLTAALVLLSPAGSSTVVAEHARSIPEAAARPPVPVHRVDWLLVVDPAARPAGPLSPALLGHYDLSGKLYDYDRLPALNALLTAGRSRAPLFNEWRMGAGRWEIGTRVLRRDSSGNECSPELWRRFELVPGALEPALPDGSPPSDHTLMDDRDWFSFDGRSVSEKDTHDDARYRLDYVRSIVDQALDMGARPFVSIDHMPRALSVNREPRRGCNARAIECSFANGVSNARPADPRVFALAVRGLVQRIVEGSGGHGGRDVTHWEIWNEPEPIPAAQGGPSYFWDDSFETDPNNPLARYFEMAVHCLTELGRYRNERIGHHRVRQLRFGLGSFLSADTAVRLIRSLPREIPFPLDFVSFHSYSDDPDEIVEAIRRVAAAADGRRRDARPEVVLAEWGRSLAAGNLSDGRVNSHALAAATVVALGASVGLDRAHRTFFYDFFPGFTFGLVAPDQRPRPVYFAYRLLGELIRLGSDRLVPSIRTESGLERKLDDGRLGEHGEDGAVLVARDGDGVRVLLVNRSQRVRTAAVMIRSGRAGRSAAWPRSATGLYAPANEAPAVPFMQAYPWRGGPLVVLPPQTIVLLAY
jgi:hypothetical protein